MSAPTILHPRKLLSHSLQHYLRNPSLVPTESFYAAQIRAAGFGGGSTALTSNGILILDE